MNLPPPSVPISTKAGMDFYLETAKFTRGFSARIREIRRIPGIANGLNSVLKRNAYLRGAFEKTDQAVLKNKKGIDESRKSLENLFKKSPGKDLAAKGASAGASLGGILAVGGLAIAVIQNTLIQNYINDVADGRSNKLDTDLTKVNGLALQAQAQVKVVLKQIDDFRLSEQRTRDRIYGLEKQNVGIGNGIDKAKKDANDALYESRKGRDIVEKKINDNLYEFRQTKARIDTQYNELKASFSKYLSGINDNFQRQITTTVDTLQKSLATANNEIRKANDSISLQGKIVSTVQASVKEVQTTLTTQSKDINTKVAEVKEFASNLVGTSVRKIQESPVFKVAQEPTVTVKYIDGVTKSLRDTYNQTFEAQAVKWNEEEAKRSKAFLEYLRQGEESIFEKSSREISNFIKEAQGELGSKLGDVEKEKKALQKNTTDQNNELTKVKQEIGNIKTDIGSIETDIKKIDTKIKEQEKVNQEGNRKLDQILPALSALPAVFGRAIDNGLKDIPKANDIERITGTAMCKSMNGGCSGRKIDDAVSQVNQNSNNNTGALADAYNAGANTALLAGQAEILSRIGAQLPGGIGGKLSRIGSWLHLDRVLNIMIWGTTIHNALMLSNDLGQTLLGIVNNVLQLFGLKKEDGQPFDIGSVISGTIENLIKGAIGADNYTQLRETWAKANRIYQATTNLLNSVLNLSQTILQASELIAAYTGKIGNALKKGGVILENAYGWMNPQPKFNRVTNFLETLQNGANTIQMVTQAPLDVVNAVTDSTTAATEFVKAFKEDDKAENKAVPIPEPDQLKAQETQAKNNSQPNPFDFSDLFDGED